jgi:hypothetical protein
MQIILFSLRNMIDPYRFPVKSPNRIMEIFWLNSSVRPVGSRKIQTIKPEKTSSSKKTAVLDKRLTQTV